MMTRRSFLTIASLTSVLSGLVGLFAPGQMGLLFGLTLDDVAVAEVRLLGAAYLGYAAIAWLARGVTDRAAVRAIALGSAASWAISAVVTVTAIVSALIGWPGVAARRRGSRFRGGLDVRCAPCTSHGRRYLMAATAPSATGPSLGRAGHSRSSDSYPSACTLEPATTMRRSGSFRSFRSPGSAPCWPSAGREIRSAGS